MDSQHTTTLADVEERLITCPPSGDIRRLFCQWYLPAEEPAQWLPTTFNLELEQLVGGAHMGVACEEAFEWRGS